MLPPSSKRPRLLKELFADTSTNRSKIAIPFCHEYSEASLDPNQLKGADRTRTDVLVRAAASVDYQCYLALLTHEQSGEVDYDSWAVRQYHSRRSYRWSDHDDDEEAGPDDVEMGEVYEEERSLDHWVDPDGRKQPFGQMHLEESELLCPEGREHWSIKQEIREATGNEGVSMDRWYRQGVIVIWPRDRYFEHPRGRRPGVGHSRARTDGGRQARATRPWQPAAPSPRRSSATGIPGKKSPASTSSRASRRMLELLETIGTPELLERFLTDVLPKDFDGSEGKALHQLFHRFGWQRFETALRSFLAQQKPENYLTRIGQVVSICVPLCCDPPALTQERRAVCVSLADPLAELIDRWDKKPLQRSAIRRV